MNVDLEALAVAFSDNSLERSYYLDRDTGRVFNLLEDHNDSGTEEIAWEIEADGGRRYIPVPKLSIEDMLREQDEFVESLEDSDLKEALSGVLESDSDGSRFEEFVNRRRDARKRWREFLKVRSRERADEWLKSLETRAS